MNGHEWLLWMVGTGIALVGVLTLVWAVFWNRERGRRRCPKCWYDMAGIEGLMCPECGVVARSEKALHRTPKRKRRLAFGSLLFVIGFVVMCTTTALVEDPLSPVPARIVFTLARFDPQTNPQAANTPDPRTFSRRWAAAQTLHRAGAAFDSIDVATTNPMLDFMGHADRVHRVSWFGLEIDASVRSFVRRAMSGPSYKEWGGLIADEIRKGDSAFDDAVVRGAMDAYEQADSRARRRAIVKLMMLADCNRQETVRAWVATISDEDRLIRCWGAARLAGEGILDEPPDAWLKELLASKFEATRDRVAAELGRP